MGSENAGLKLNLQKFKTLVSTTSWQIDWRGVGQVEAVKDFIQVNSLLKYLAHRIF